MTSGLEVVPAFFWCEHIADIADGLEKVFEGSGSDASQVGFQFREGHLYRIQVWTVGRQEQKPAAPFLQGVCRCNIFVGCKVVQKHDRAWLQDRGKLGADVSLKSRTIHGPFDHPGRNQAFRRQASNEGLRVP